jgi:hypothetical protein
MSRCCGSSSGHVAYTAGKTRPSPTVVLVSAEEWQLLQELESAESTAWWRRDAAECAASGEQSESGEDGPGLDEAVFAIVC